MPSINRPAKRARTIRRAVVRSGFSMLEVVAVLAIIATMGMIAIPRYGAAVARYRVHAAATRIASELDRIRDRSRRAGEAHTVKFVAGKGGMLILRTADASVESRLQLKTEPYWSIVNQASLGGDSEMVFDGYGVPDSGGTVVVRHGSLGITITIDAAGGTTISNPARIASGSIVAELEDVVLDGELDLGAVDLGGR